jgi:selenocysteine-specific elongation factor
MISVQLKLLPYVRRPLQHNLTVNFFTGAAESSAKVRLLENEKLQPGETTWAQLVLKLPVVIVKGDRYIIRSPLETIGGGVVIEAHAERLRRFRPSIIELLKVQLEGGGESSLMAAFEAKQPLLFQELKTKSQLPEADVLMIVESLIRQGNLLRIGEGDHALLYTEAGISRIGEAALDQLKEYHQKYPLRTGMPKVELGSRLKLGKNTNEILQKLGAAGKLDEGGIFVRLPTHRVTLSAGQQREIASFLKALSQNPYSPPGDLIPEPDILNLLIEQNKVVKVSEGVVFDAAVYEGMVQKIKAHIKTKGRVTLAEVRDLFNTSRKYAQAFMEYLDEKRITRRLGDERVLF